MESHLNEEQKAIQKAAKGFAEGEFEADRALEFDKNGQFPFELWKKACHLGFKGLDLPERYGGQGYGLLEKLTVLHEFCKVDSTLGASLGLADMGSRIVMKLGDDDQKNHLLAPTTRGQSISAVATDIPLRDEKSQFRIEQQGKSFIINGKKEFVVNGQIADSFLLIGRLGREAADPWCVLAVQSGLEGLLRESVTNPLGLRTSSLGNVIFDHVELNESDLLDRRLHSSQKVFEFLNERKMETSIQAVGIAQNAFGKALDYSRQREQFKKKIIEFQGIQLMLADDAIQIEAARALMFRFFDSFGHLHSRSEAFTAFANVTKTFCTDMSVKVALDAIRTFGGYGVIADYHVERAFRDAKVLQHLEGDFTEDKSSVALSFADGLRL